MYVTAREITPLPGRLQDTISVGTQLIGEMNQKYGSAMATSSEIGGNPNKLWITGFWSTLDDYQSFTESYMSDPELVGTINLFTSFVSEVQDQIGQVLRQPGERKSFTQMHRGRVKSEHMHAGLDWMLRTADYVSELTGTEAGIVAPVTGDQYELIFINYADSLQELRGMVETWGVDEGYLELFAEGVQLFDPTFDVTYNRMIS
jgi:hypothetical protein